MSNEQTPNGCLGSDVRQTGFAGKSNRSPSGRFAHRHAGSPEIDVNESSGSTRASRLTRRALGLAAGLLCTSSLLSGAAHAEWKGYSGANCHPPNNSFAYYRSTAGRFYNSNDFTLNVICPVVRDISAGGPNRALRARVSFRDNHITQNVSCRFSSRTQSGTLHDSASDVSGTSPIVLEHVDASNWGSYVLHCRLPGRDPSTGQRSYISSYALEEIDGPQ